MWYHLIKRKSVPFKAQLTDDNVDLLLFSKESRKHFESHRRIRCTVVGRSLVSTVFLGMDHAYMGPPMLFETMVFNSDNFEDVPGYDNYRCTTHRQALKQHWNTVSIVKGMTKNE